MLQIKRSELKKLAQNKLGDDSIESQNKVLVMISTSLAARTSYTTVGEEKGIDYQKLIKIHDKCKEMNHSSVFEHCARVMSDSEYFNFVKGNTTDAPNNSIYGWCNNLKGFIPYRYFIDNKIEL